jgi:hypothetical protein
MPRPTLSHPQQQGQHGCIVRHCSTGFQELDRGKMNQLESLHPAALGCTHPIESQSLLLLESIVEVSFRLVKLAGDHIDVTRRQVENSFPVWSGDT